MGWSTLIHCQTNFYQKTVKMSQVNMASESKGMSSQSQGTFKKFSEDPKLRPFLSSHFDAQNFIKVR